MRNDFYIGCYNDPNYLAHYGVLGMKWGIRRYQNYDGSYTQKGLKRLREDEANYKSAKEGYKKIKEAYKIHKKTGQDIHINGNRVTDPKAAVKLSKQFVKMKKKDMNKSYKRLKEHKLADQGKNLYARGVRITGNARLAQLAGLTSAGAGYATTYLLRVGNKKLATYSALAGVGALAAEGILMGKNLYQDRRLRAYYGHHQ